MRKRIKTFSGRLILIVLSIFLFFLFAGCSQYFSSNGQRIFVNAESTSGQPITYTGGPGMMMQSGLTCVNCHGPEGHGGIVRIMMQDIDVPDITWPTLTEDDPPYTEETLKRAITQGLDPSGDPLEYPMPHWQMSDQDLNDLVNYIKTLK